jgi:hypothetical protein
MLISPRLVPAVLIVLFTASVPAALASQCHGDPTDTSSPGLLGLYEELFAPRLDEVQGIPVTGAEWSVGPFTLELVDATVWVEPRRDGSPLGMFFVGEAVVSYAPETKAARAATRLWFEEPQLERVPISHGYMFWPGTPSPIESVESRGEPTVPFTHDALYGADKQVLRHLGLRLAHFWLNRDTRANGGFYFVFAPSWLASGLGSEQARLVYAHEPGELKPKKLLVAGHRAALEHPRYRRIKGDHYVDHLWPIVRDGREPVRPQGDVATVRNDLDLTEGGSATVALESAISLTPGEDIGALLFALTSRLTVESVTIDGEPAEHVQWEYQPNRLDLDPVLLVRPAHPLDAEREHTVTVRAQGRLFEATWDWDRVSGHGRGGWVPEGGGVLVLSDEDAWYPRLDDPSGALFEQVFRAPSRYTVVGSGQLVEHEEGKGADEYTYRGTRPVQHAGFYYGELMSAEGKADETQIEVYVDRGDRDARKNRRFVVNEIENMIRVYNRILDHPLEAGTLRIASTPTFHGRGFDGLLLLSRFAGFRGDLSDSDLFRAHEVAHQWWGNVVRIEDWQTDRWIGEGFTDYLAMEYYRARFDKPEKVNELIYDRWVWPLLESPEMPFWTLTGKNMRRRDAGLCPLSEGTGVAYERAPMVLNSLRALFRARNNNSDEGFWLLMQDFIDAHEYGVVDTADFVQMASEKLGVDLRPLFDQWLYRSEIPTVTWSHRVEQREGQQVLVVEAEQDTDYDLFIPMRIHMDRDKYYPATLVLSGRTGKVEIPLPREPKDVTLNDSWEVLARIKER